jgi:hypothetical protein
MQMQLAHGKSRIRGDDLIRPQFDRLSEHGDDSAST